ncbi:MAG: helix-turn-helix domain-containing protein [Roseburia intestinalis]
MEKNQETLKEIEKKRKELGLSQVELAKRIGFSRGYYNMLDNNGKAKPVSASRADQLQQCFVESPERKRKRL